MISHSWKVNAAFWTLGLINNFTFVLFLSAAEDILTGYAGVILFLTVVPGLLSKTLFSFYAERIPYLVRIIAVATSSTLCSLAVALSPQISTKLLAIVVQSAIGALGEISYLALTSRFHESSVGAWSSGTGGAGIAGAGAYVVFRDVFSFSSRTTLVVCSPLPLLMIVIYRAALSNTSQYQAVQGNESMDSDPQSDYGNRLSRRQYFRTLFLTYMIPLSGVYFGEYTINQGVLGTLSEFTDGKKHNSANLYRKYQFVYQVGVFISRSSIQLIQINSLWILPILQILNLIILTLSSMYTLLPSFAVAVLIVLWEGLLGGLTYVNAFFKLRNEAPLHLKEWALATATVADATGISVAAIASIWLEHHILRFRGVQ